MSEGRNLILNSKLDILNEIEKGVPLFQKVSFDQYKIRCPFCGDSVIKDHAHMYLKCSSDINEPILYHCFKCNIGGKINQAFLDKIGVTLTVPETLSYFNKLSSAKSKYDISEGTPDLDSPQYKYLQYRLHEDFSIEELSKFRIVWDIESLVDIITNKRIKNTLPSNRNSISFYTDDNCCLLTRSFDDTIRWKKTTLFPSSRSFYSIRRDLDLFSKRVNVIIAEGVFDILSLYKNFYDENGVYIATLGSDYCSAIEYSISLGLIGSSVNMNIYLDSDIDLKKIKFKMKQYKWLFNSITLFKNILDKDYGIPKENIKLEEYKV